MKNYQLNTNSVALEFYKNEFDSPLQDYHLSGEQLNFTAHPLEALIKCQGEPKRHPIVILYNNVPAGFFVLHLGDGAKEYSENKKAILLRAYSISTPFQGEGIAKRSLILLPTFVNEHFPEINEIVLAVNLKNTIAQKLYFTCGFVDTCKRVIGRAGEQYILQMKL
ncbi:GNAT family N-acetyltransferase [Bacillus sp. DJP31]|uniref:GNAT family N-acetyltransferase n=1 Tax=Bacillus sp. DJP31 TaxID=3409789 RepID=UPI003BB6D6D8